MCADRKGGDGGGGVAAAVNNERGAPQRTALASGGKQSRTWVKTVLGKLNIS